MNLRITSLIALTSLGSIAPAGAQNIGQSGTTELAGRDSAGLVPSGQATYPSLSADGRYLAFGSSSALVPEDTNGLTDVYVLDRQTGVLTLASTTAGGTQGNGSSTVPHLSADGRWVVFQSGATNFAPLENGHTDIFRKDLLTGAIDRVSNAHLSAAAANAGSLKPTVSDDGRYVAFVSWATDLTPSDLNLVRDIFVRDMQTGQVWRVSDGVWGQSNGISDDPMISGDGSRVTYYSWASNLVLWDNNGAADIFIVEPGKNPTRLTDGNDWSGHPSISQDAAWVAFESPASNLVPGDGNSTTDVFLLEVATGDIQMMSVDINGMPGPGVSSHAAVARDGSAVAFRSDAPLTGLNGLGASIWVRDVEAGTIVNVSVADGATTVGNDDSYEPTLALGGRLVAFHSNADNLVPDDTNGNTDVFVRTPISDPFTYCTASTTTHGCQPTLSSSGYPSPTSGQPFTIVGDDLPNQKTGLFFYGFSGASANPWGNGTMCVAGAKKRTPLMSSFGTPPATDDCTGSVALDMNLFAAGALGGSPKPELSVVGQVVHVQYWGRDPEASSGTFLSDALEYEVGP